MIKSNFAPSDSIVLASSSLGSTTATLGATDWSALDVPFHKGYIIKPVAGTGLAVVNDDPDHQSREISITVYEVFSTTVYGSSEWTYNVAQDVTLSDYFPSHVNETLLLPDIFSTASDLVLHEYRDAIKRFKTLREWDRVDETYLNQYLRTAGLFIDLTSVDTEHVRYLNREIANFHENSGTEYLTSFLGYILDLRIEGEPLYTEDYVDFVEFSESGRDDHYPTNHVSLLWDGLLYDDPDTDLLVSLFYEAASVPLILDSFGKLWESENAYVGVGVNAHTSSHYLAEDVSSLSADIFIGIGVNAHLSGHALSTTDDRLSN